MADLTQHQVDFTTTVDFTSGLVVPLNPADAQAFYSAFANAGLPVPDITTLQTYLSYYRLNQQNGDSNADIINAWYAQGIDRMSTAVFLATIQAIEGGSYVTPNQAPSVGEIVSTDLTAAGNAAKAVGGAITSGVTSGFTAVLPWVIGAAALYLVLTTATKTFVQKRL